MRNTTIDVAPVSGGVGAEIANVDLSHPLNEQTYLEIRAALNEYGVIFFRDQSITPEQHVDLGRQFGMLVPGRGELVPGFPELAVVRKEPEQKHNIGGDWHTDHSFLDTPPLGTILHALELPPFGGDTLFLSMANAYDRLSDGLKQTLEGLNAIHSLGLLYDKLQSRNADSITIKPDAPRPEALHPVVLRHPENGRKILYVNAAYTVRFEGWTREESLPLLEFLYGHARRPEYSCRFRWQPGSVAFWDDRQVWHYAVNDYQGERRIMHKLIVAGTPPLAA